MTPLVFTNDDDDDALIPGYLSLDRLTPREREIVRLLGTGACNKEIATQLNIAVSTVKRHCTSIFLKLNLSNRVAAAIFMQQFRASRSVSVPEPSQPAFGRGDRGLAQEAPRETEGGAEGNLAEGKVTCTH